MPKYTSNDAANFENEASKQVDYYDQSKLLNEQPRITPTVPGLILDPNRIQTTHQSTFSNWVNTLSNAMDGISEGPAKHRIIDIDHRLDLLEEDHSVDFEEKLRLREELNLKKTMAMQEVAEYEADIKDSPVDLDYQIKSHFRLTEENTNLGDWFSQELPEELGGTLSMWGTQLASIVLPSVARGVAAGTIGGPIGNLV
jgi:hypothetical protein